MSRPAKNPNFLIEEVSELIPVLEGRYGIDDPQLDREIGEVARPRPLIGARLSRPIWCGRTRRWGRSRGIVGRSIWHNCPGMVRAANG